MENKNNYLAKIWVKCTKRASFGGKGVPFSWRYVADDNIYEIIASGGAVAFDAVTGFRAEKGRIILEGLINDDDTYASLSMSHKYFSEHYDIVIYISKRSMNKYFMEEDPNFEDYKERILDDLQIIGCEVFDIEINQIAVQELNAKK